LLEKLWSIDITGTLWAWFKNYLMDRFQKVSINDNLSKTLPVVSRVNDITSTIQHNHLLQFADVLKLFHLCYQPVTSSRGSINVLFNWTTSAHLNFNLSKCMQVYLI